MSFLKNWEHSPDQCPALHDHHCDRAPKSFRDSEKFIAAVQACHAQKNTGEFSASFIVQVAVGSKQPRTGPFPPDARVVS